MAAEEGIGIERVDGPQLTVHSKRGYGRWVVKVK